MYHWSPSSDSFIEYIQVGGWNVAFSVKERIQGTNLYGTFIRKGYSDNTASKMAQMILCKQKYHLQYSKEQEEMIQRAHKAL
jgi:hypothetical protein